MADFWEKVKGAVKNPKKANRRLFQEAKLLWDGVVLNKGHRDIEYQKAKNYVYNQLLDGVEDVRKFIKDLGKYWIGGQKEKEGATLSEKANKMCENLRDGIIDFAKNPSASKRKEMAKNLAKQTNQLKADLVEVGDYVTEGGRRGIDTACENLKNIANAFDRFALGIQNPEKGDRAREGRSF